MPLRRLAAWAFTQPYLLLATTMAFWGGNFVVGRALAGVFPPVTLAQIRWAVAALIVLPFAWRHLRADWPELRRRWGMVTLLSLTGITLYNTLAYVGLQYTEAINGLLIQSTAPLLIAFWSLVLYRDRLTAAQIAGILVSLTGVAVIVLRGDFGTLRHLAFNVGDAWLLLALALYALYSALLKRRPAVHWLSLLGITLAWGAILLAPATAWELASGARPQITGGTMAALLYVCVFPSVVAYICFNRGVDLIGPNRAGPMFHLIALFGSVLAILFLGEQPRLFHFVGYALIIGGIIVAQGFGQRGRAVRSPAPAAGVAPSAPPPPPRR